MDDLNQQLAGAVIRMDSAEVRRLATLVIHQGLSPVDAIEHGLAVGMNEVGRRFVCGDYFVPEVLVAAQAMYAGFDLLKEYVPRDSLKSKGTVVIGVVERDVHDIGKNIVKLMIEAAGFRVVDLGKSASAQKFLDVAREENAEIVALSTLMTTTMERMAKTVELLRSEAPEIKIMVGGAPISARWAASVGAHFYGANARDAVIGAHTLAGVPIPN